MKKRLAFAMSTLLVLTLLVTAATSQNVTITATPEYMDIANAPGSFDFLTVAAGVDENTGNDYFTITNGSTVVIDIDIQCNGWSGVSSWTYGVPGADQGRMQASSGEGGVGGSGGSGTYDIQILDSVDTLIMDAVGTSTNPQWELQIDVASSFTFGDEQTSTVTLTASAN
jgi:hypothetical protein